MLSKFCIRESIFYHTLMLSTEVRIITVHICWAPAMCQAVCGQLPLTEAH